MKAKLTPNQKRLNYWLRCGYTPHEKQAGIHESPERFRIVAAGARAGKSMLAGAEVAATLLKPGKRIWIVAAQYELADKEFDWALQFLSMAPWSDGRKLIDLARVTSAAHGSRIISFPWGSWVKTKSCEKPTSLLGEEIDLMVLGEASQIPRDSWARYLRARLGSRRGRLLATSTPNSDSGLFMEFFENGLKNEGDYADWKSWQFSTLDNPTFPREEWTKLEKELATDVFREQCRGEFVSRRGKVFKEFDKVHLADSLPAGAEHWTIVRGVQRGFANPAVCLWIALETDAKQRICGYWVVDELYELEMLPKDFCGKIIEKSKGKRILATMGNYWEQEVIAEFSRYGVPCQANDEKKLNKNVALIKRIQAIQNVMKIHPDGRTRFHVLKSCKHTIEELDKLKWPDRQKEEAERAEIEIPLSKYLPIPSALSYAITFIETCQNVDVYGLLANKGAKQREIISSPRNSPILISQ